MRHDAGLLVKGYGDNLAKVRTKRNLMFLKQNTKSPLHFLSHSISPQNDKIDKTRQNIFGNQKPGLKSLCHLKLSLLGIKSNVCV